MSGLFVQIVLKIEVHNSVLFRLRLRANTVKFLDAANDLALLKAEGWFAALPVAASRGVKLGGTVATVGFPKQDFNEETRKAGENSGSWFHGFLI